MNKIVVKSKTPIDDAIKICTEYYKLRNHEYELTKVNEDNVTVELKTRKVIDSILEVLIHKNAFEANLVLLPGINGGSNYNLPDILHKITDQNIKSYDTQNISNIFEDYLEGTVNFLYPVAQGIPPKKGKDAELILHFNKDLKKTPRIVNGKVDFKQITHIPIVKKGQQLITKKPKIEGSRGVNIFGEESTPEPVKDITILLSDGATVNETGTVYTATISGYVDFNGVKLGVYPVYVVDQNVDNSTGNIKFNGSVYVKGDVLSGFKIEASKNVVVDGVCQDCEIIAKGNVTLQSGMKCKKLGIIKAGGDVLAGYIESATVYAKGNIDIRKYAYNSNLFAGNNIIATTGEGVIAGGYLKAFNEIYVKQLGTNGNTLFTVSLGSKYYNEFELEKINEEVNKINDTLDKIDIVLDRVNYSSFAFGENPKIDKMIELKSSLIEFRTILNQKKKKILKDNKAKSPKLKIKEKVYEGVTVKIHEATDVVKQPRESMVASYDIKYEAILWLSMSNISTLE